MERITAAAQSASQPLLCRLGLVTLRPSSDGKRSKVVLRAPFIGALMWSSLGLALIQFIVGCVLMGGGFNQSGLGPMVGAIGTCLFLLSLANAGGLAVLLITKHLPSR